MNTVLCSDVRRAAKPHRCYYCDQRIEIGELHGYRTGVSYGDFWTMRYHPECDEAARDWDEEDYEYFDPGTMPRPMDAFDPQI